MAAMMAQAQHWDSAGNLLSQYLMVFRFTGHKAESGEHGQES